MKLMTKNKEAPELNYAGFQKRISLIYQYLDYIFAYYMYRWDYFEMLCSQYIKC
jgi:hypothetical protein